MTDMTETQKQLEAEQLELGERRYLSMLKTKGEAEMGPGRRLIAAHVDKMVVAINAATKRKRGPRAAYITYLTQVEPVSAAMLALRTTLQQVGREETKTATAVARSIGRMLVEHLNWKNLHDAEEIGKGARFMEQKVLKQENNERRRRAIASHYYGQHLPPDCTVDWEETVMIQVGMLLLELIRTETGLIHMPVVMNHGRKTTRIELTDMVKEWLTSRHGYMSLLDPLFMPMVVPPKPWTNTTDGGYLTRPSYLIKAASVEYQREARGRDMGQLLDAVNLLQGTAYKVNTGVLAVVSEALATNAAIAGLVDQEMEPANAKPADIKTNKEALKDWKIRERERHDRNAAKRNTLVTSMRIEGLARKFSEYPAIYFPMFLDFRGRAYPKPVDLQPQGSDLAKGLLTFAEGKPLGTAGLFWLKVHVANLFGVDKVSFEERAQWVNENLEILMECAINPLGVDFWQQADKPWQALAAIFEVFGAVVADDHRSYVSHLPIAMDGSCNGLQNLSAMMLDEEGGKATNLVPADKPQDIYTQVLDRTIAKLTDRAALILGDMEEHDRAVVLLNLGLNRKIVKRPVMTRPYGSTAFGTKEMLMSEMQKQGLYDKLPGDRAEKFAHVSLLGQLVAEAINEVVLASKEVMDWLQECARVAAEANLSLSWVTPVGFHAEQAYMQVVATRPRIWVGGQQKEISLAERTDDVNKRRSASSISPNVIHSFDASHMMLTILRSNEEFGITDFCMVHDSYATHACNVGELAAALRAVFIEMYSINQLEDLYQQFHEQLPSEVAAQLPLAPARGNLDLTQVEDSYYFFA